MKSASQRNDARAPSRSRYSEAPALLWGKPRPARGRTRETHPNAPQERMVRSAPLGTQKSPRSQRDGLFICLRRWSPGQNQLIQHLDFHGERAYLENPGAFIVSALLG